MESIRFIHAADPHLGATFQSTDVFNEDWIARLQQSTWAAFDNLLDLAIDNHVDFLLLSGDIFDRESYSVKARKFFRKRISRLSSNKIHSYIILGNHDLSIDDHEIRTMFNGDPYIHIFSNEKVEVITHYKNYGKKVKIYGRGFWNAEPSENPALEYIESANSDPEDVLKIAIAHGRVGEVNEYLPCASFSLTDLKTACIHYWAMGHMHKRRVFIDEVPLVVNPGRIQGTSIDELDTRGCYLVEWKDKQLIDIRFHSLEAVRFEKTRFNFNDGTITEMDEALKFINLQLKNRYKQTGKPIIMQLLLEGQTTLYYQLRKKETLREIQRKLSGDDILVFDILDQTIPFIDTESMKNGDVILEEYLSVLESVKADHQSFNEMESYLQTFYSDSTFQKITGTRPGQRGRGQWKFKKIKKEWLLWVDEAKKLGIDMILLSAGEQTDDPSIGKIMDELSEVLTDYYLGKSGQTIITRIMREYEELSLKCTFAEAHNKDDETIILKRKINQTDGELYRAVKQWTLYTMAMWAFGKVRLRRNGDVISGNCTH